MSKKIQDSLPFKPYQKEIYQWYEREVLPWVWVVSLQKPGIHGLYEHTNNVVFRAIDYALQEGKNPIPVVFAAALHDAGRDRDGNNDIDHAGRAVPLAEEILELFKGKSFQITPDLVYPPLTKKEENSILHAIRKHTTGQEAKDYVSSCLWDADRTRLAWMLGFKPHHFRGEYAKQVAQGSAEEYLINKSRLLGELSYSRSELENQAEEINISSPVSRLSSGKNVCLYHVSDKNHIADFIKRGGAGKRKDGVVGHGYGGQSDGFFLFTSLPQADDHVRFLQENMLDTAEHDRDKVIIGLQYPADQIDCSEWKFDMETNRTTLFSLFSDYVEEVNKIKNLSYQTIDLSDPREQKRPARIVSVDYTKREDISDGYKQSYEGAEGVLLIQREGKDRFIEIVDKTKPFPSDGVLNQMLYLPELEAIAEYLLAHCDSFREAYDKKLRYIMTESHGGETVKYCGEKPLSISEIIYCEYHKKEKLNQYFELYSLQNPHPVANYIIRNVHYNIKRGKNDTNNKQKSNRLGERNG